MQLDALSAHPLSHPSSDDRPLHVIDAVDVLDRGEHSLTLRGHTHQHRLGAPLDQTVTPGDSVVLRADFVTPEIVRLRLYVAGALPADPPATIELPPTMPATEIDTPTKPSALAAPLDAPDADVALKSPRLILTFHRAPCRLSLRALDGDPLFETLPRLRTAPGALPLGFAGSTIFFSIPRRYDEYFYALGGEVPPERLSLRVNGELSRQPGLLSTRGYALWIDAPAVHRFDLGAGSVTFYGDGPALDLYILYGPHFSELMTRAKRFAVSKLNGALHLTSGENGSKPEAAPASDAPAETVSPPTIDNWAALQRWFRRMLVESFSHKFDRLVKIERTSMPELFIRQAQIGIFTPLPRCTVPDEQIEAGALEVYQKYQTLRKRLTPYITNEWQRAVEQGHPLLRPLFLDFPDDPTTFYIEDQYLFGRWIMLAPVLDERTARRVYLPEGRWFDAWTGKVYQGARWIQVETPLEVLPMFMRGGAILPMQPEPSDSASNAMSPLTLDLYPHYDSAFTVRELGGGKTEFECQQDGDTVRVRITPSEDTPERTYVLHVNGIIRPVECRLNGALLPAVITSDDLDVGLGRERDGWLWSSDQLALIRVRGSNKPQEIIVR